MWGDPVHYTDHLHDISVALTACHSVMISYIQPHFILVPTWECLHLLSKQAETGPNHNISGCSSYQSHPGCRTHSHAVNHSPLGRGSRPTGIE